MATGEGAAHAGGQDVREPALPQKSKNGVRWYPQFPVMSQRDYGLQPRVAASATLGKEGIWPSTAKRLRLLCAFLAENPQPRCG